MGAIAESLGTGAARLLTQPGNQSPGHGFTAEEQNNVGSHTPARLLREGLAEQSAQNNGLDRTLSPQASTSQTRSKSPPVIDMQSSRRLGTARPIDKESSNLGAAAESSTCLGTQTRGLEEEHHVHFQAENGVRAYVQGAC
jgi:hypothetical protein